MSWDRLGHLPTDVYWAYDADDRLLYVGMTSSLEVRLRGHYFTKPWFRQVTRVETESFPNRAEAIDREWEAIREGHPIHNVRTERRPDVVLPPVIRRDIEERAL